MSKRLLSLLLAAVLLVTTLVVTTAGAVQQKILYGDTDGDGNVTILDATAIQRHLAAIDILDEAALERGMVTGGSELTILDATAIQRKLASLPTHEGIGTKMV